MLISVEHLADLMAEQHLYSSNGIAAVPRSASVVRNTQFWYHDHSEIDICVSRDLTDCVLTRLVLI